MIQEVLTYLIIGSAVTVTLLKAVKKFRRKKSSKKLNVSNVKISLQHNCSDCSAECILRDTVTPKVSANRNLCKKTEILSD